MPGLAQNCSVKLLWRYVLRLTFDNTTLFRWSTELDMRRAISFQRVFRNQDHDGRLGACGYWLSRTNRRWEDSCN